MHIIIGILVGLGIVVYPIARLGSEDSVNVVVEDKERVNSSESSKYLVFTDKEVFENTDELLKGKFNSSDVYGKLKVGGKYKCEVLGWRIQFFSMYRNIISCIEGESK